jgi:hypothetical protein
MTHAFRCWILRGFTAAGLVLVCSGRAGAQWIAPPATDAPAETTRFMPRYDFHLSADALASGDKEFWWDTHFGGDFDLVTYKHGRSTFLADYQAILGKQIRLFDPDQGNYLLEASTSVRAGKTEFAGVFHHESRHLGDRIKVDAIAWNVMQLRVYRRIQMGTSAIDLRGDAGKVLARAFVDYSWTLDADARITRPVTPHVSAYGHGYAETFGVIETPANRGRQTGGRAEAGIRVSGERGAVDLFAGWERVIDADAFAGVPRSWAFAGFRLVSK